MKKPRTKQDVQDGASCANCRYWYEVTQSHDEVRWGECRWLPPVILIPVDPEEGPVCDVPNTVLPYSCGQHTPRLQ